MVFHPKIVWKVQKFTLNGPEKNYFIQGSRPVCCRAISRKKLNREKSGKIRQLPFPGKMWKIKNAKKFFSKNSIVQNSKPDKLKMNFSVLPFSPGQRLATLLVWNKWLKFLKISKTKFEFLNCFSLDIWQLLTGQDHDWSTHMLCLWKNVFQQKNY